MKTLLSLAALLISPAAALATPSVDAPTLRANLAQLQSHQDATVAPDLRRPVARRTKGLRPGALSGRRIALSAGHGWIADGDGWRLQRSRWAFDGCGGCRGVTEDTFNAELVNDHLLPLLERMGAEVVLVREGDDQLQRHEVDDAGPGYVEEGMWTPGNSDGPYLGTYRVLAPEDPGTADFEPNFETTASRRVSIRWLGGANRTSQAVVEIHHRGGLTEVPIDQQQPGHFWLDVGRYVLGPGDAVRLRRDIPDGHLVADAVKFGGGVHPSGHPWWQMAAQSYVASAGASAEVSGLNDVTIRPRYIEEIGADAYLSIHGNASGQAGGSTANGATSYRYSCQLYGDHSRSESAVNCDDPAGSRALSHLVQDAVVASVRAHWDEDFGDNGVRVADFGELRELDDTPGALLETAFFDNIALFDGGPAYTDNQSMHDPRFRDAVAYGAAAGLARYFDADAGAPPLRPEGLRAWNRADGALQVRWTPVSGATGYRLYLATEGRGWDAGQPIMGPGVVLYDALIPRQVYALRVAAVNADGEGFASQAVAFRFRGAALLEDAQPAQAVLVYGYDRRDAWAQVPDNDLSYAVEHGHGLGAVEDLFFDGALDEAVESGDLELAAYDLVDYAAGKDSTEHLALSAGMRQMLRAYVEAGGAVLLSGEEIGWQMVETSDDPAEAAFLNEVMGARYVADDARTFGLTGVGPLANVGAAVMDDGSLGSYEVRYPDVWAATEEGSLALAYPDGSGAAIATERTLLFGVGLEAVYPDEARAAIFEAAVAHLLGAQPTGDLDMDGASDACERRYGLDHRDAADGAEDLDGDGMTNAEACAAGLDPRGEGAPDLGLVDAAVEDAGVADAQPDDAAPADADLVDGGALDGLVPPIDADVHDASQPSDAGSCTQCADAAPCPTPAPCPVCPSADAGPLPSADNGDSGCSLGVAPGAPVGVPLALSMWVLGVVTRRRRS